MIRADYDDKFKLVNINVKSGTATQPEAEVGIELGGTLMTETVIGDGPVDAVFKAISSITGTKSKLLRYVVNAITGGTDALGEVTVRIKEGNFIALGQGSHTDIILASAKAYINALNRLEHIKRESATV